MCASGARGYPSEAPGIGRKAWARVECPPMAKTVIVKLVDDLEGGDAEETVTFALDGKNYEIDLNKKNSATLRKALAPYMEKGRSAGRQPGLRRQAGTSGPTLFSQLSIEEKERFRKWAKLPNARRIGDARVKEWTDAGKP